MWQLDDESAYDMIHSFSFPEAFTYADTTPGQTDREKRERIRKAAATGFPSSIPRAKWWAFRILVRKSGSRRFDVENVPKLIVDAFCQRQIREDRSPWTQLGLYPDDTIDYVRVVEVGGERTTMGEMTHVEIFARK